MRAPVGGQSDSTTVDLLDDTDASLALNVVFDFKGIQKRQGRSQVGDRRPAADYAAVLGYQMRLRDGTTLNLVVGGTHLYKDDGGAWVGAVSEESPPTSEDVIAISGLGSAAQFNDRLYFVDMGGSRRVFDPSVPSIGVWGPSGAGQPEQPTDQGAGLSNGTLTAGKYYTTAFYFRNSTTGVRGRVSVRSDAYAAGGGGTDLPYENGTTIRGTAINRGQLTQLTPDVPSGSYYSWTHETPLSRTFITAIYTADSVQVPRSQWTQDSAFDPDVRYVFLTPTYDQAGLLFDGIKEATTEGNSREFDITDMGGSWEPGMDEIVLLRTKGQADVGLAETAQLYVERVYEFDGSFSFPVIAGESGPGLNTSDIELGEAIADGEGDVAAYPVPQMDAILLVAERIVGYHGSHVYYSEEAGTGLGVHGFPPAPNDVAVAVDSGDDLRGIFDLRGQTFVVKERTGVFRLNPELAPDGALLYAAERVAGAGGCVGPHSVLCIDGYAYWFDRNRAVEFDGSQIRDISSEQIRRTFAAYAAGADFDLAYAYHVRQADKSYVGWAVPNPDEGVVDHLLYDLVLRRWFIHRAAGLSTVEDTGHFDTVTWAFRDDDDQDWTYTADAKGYAYRLRADEDGNDVWTDNGQAYEMVWRSKLHGNGLDPLMPCYVDLEVERSPAGKTDGDLVVNLHRGGWQERPFRRLVPLFDDGEAVSRAVRVNTDLEQAPRLGVELRHAGEGAVTVVHPRLSAKSLPGRLIGSA